jgi:hypothetical protein
VILERDQSVSAAAFENRFGVWGGARQSACAQQDETSNSVTVADWIAHTNFRWLTVCASSSAAAWATMSAPRESL